MFERKIVKTKYKRLGIITVLVFVFAFSFFVQTSTVFSETCDAQKDLSGSILPGDTPGTIKARIGNISETGCTYDIGLATYKLYKNHLTTPFDDFINSQILFDSQIKTIGPLSIENLVVQIPDCAYQTDLFEGAFALEPPFYGGDGHALIDFEFDYTDGLCSIEPPPPSPSSLTLIKTVINDDGGTATVSDFDLFVNNANIPSGVAVTIPSGSYTVSETNIPGYSAGSWGGDCDSSGNVSLSPGQHKTCTITNNDIPIVIPPTPTCSMFASPSSILQGQSSTLSWTSENILAVLINNGIGTVPTSGSRVVFPTVTTTYTGTFFITVGVSPPANITCSATVTVSTIPPLPSSLKLVKTVINNDSGTAVVSDFRLFIGSTEVTSGVAVTLPTGSYTASEINIPGYTEGSWGGDCDSAGNVGLSPGQHKTCTITNNDIPIPPNPSSITLVKIVVNDDGGTAAVSDFDLFIDTTQVASGVAVTLSSGTYVASEVNIPGYTEGSWGGDCDSAGNVGLSPGQHKTCTITNNDTPPTCVDATITNSSFEAMGRVGQAFSYTIKTSGSGTITIGANGLPGGLSLSGNTISGTPTNSSTFDITITAENSCGSDSKKLIIVIDIPPGCVVNCGGGANPPKVVLFQKADDRPLASQSFIYLSQIPYTGVGNIFQIFLFFISILSLSALGTYSLLKYGIYGKLKELRREFFKEKHNKKVLEEIPFAEEKESEQKYFSAPTLEFDKYTQENMVILSNAGKKFLKELGHSKEATINLLRRIIEKAKSLYPREDGWLLLNRERIKKIYSIM